MNSLARFKSESWLLLPVFEGIGGTVFSFVVVSVSVSVDLRKLVVVDDDEAAVCFIGTAVKAWPS